MVVVGMGVEDPLDLIDADSQRREGLLDVGPRIDEVDPALEIDDAPHAGLLGIPSVAFPDVHDRKVFPPEAVEAQRIGGLVAFSRAEVQVHAHGLPPVRELVHVEADALHRDPRAQLDGFRPDAAGLQQLLRSADFAEREPELHPHVVGRRFPAHARRHELLYGRKPVVPAEDVLALRLDLAVDADEQRLSPRVVRVPRDHHALPVEHLEDGELGEIGKGFVLGGDVGEEDRIRTGFERDAAFLGGDDEPLFHQELDAVSGAPAQYV